jgi:hypothetical protein
LSVAFLSKKGAAACRTGDAAAICLNGSEASAASSDAGARGERRHDRSEQARLAWVTARKPQLEKADLPRKNSEANAGIPVY